MRITQQIFVHVILGLFHAAGKPKILLFIFPNKTLTFQKRSPEERSIMSADGTVPIPRWLTGVPRRYCKLRYKIHEKVCNLVVGKDKDRHHSDISDASGEVVLLEEYIYDFTQLGQDAIGSNHIPPHLKKFTSIRTQFATFSSRIGTYATPLRKVYLVLDILMIVNSLFFHSRMELSLTANLLAAARFPFCFANSITLILKPALCLLRFAGPILTTEMGYNELHQIFCRERERSRARSDLFKDKSKERNYVEMSGRILYHTADFCLLPPLFFSFTVVVREVYHCPKPRKILRISDKNFPHIHFRFVKKKGCVIA
ncbi:hypothetical protein CDAR_166491 [Caerostris darwini]|uniref:Uncharacterized protein n=1 Tax=Caerostris darwini TaxID=1538125 RepID=A0AAV4VWM1_9ARAC|nr:hypothetical protein CDAR_166491 [Caerostris darwini]